MAEETDMVQGSIVLVGKFNPGIFAPAWFRMNGLINDAEFEAAELEVVHPQVTKFKIDHMTVTVETGKFQIEVTSEPLIRMVDIVIGAFRDLLPHTPLNAVGINYIETWRMDSPERRIAFGRKLAPVEPWGDWGLGFDRDKELVGGMVKLVMQQPFRKETPGHLRVDVTPTETPGRPSAGVAVAVNYHREVDLPEGDGSRQIIQIVMEQFDDAMRNGKQTVEKLREFANLLELK